MTVCFNQYWVFFSTPDGVFRLKEVSISIISVNNRYGNSHRTQFWAVRHNSPVKITWLLLYSIKNNVSNEGQLLSLLLCLKAVVWECFSWSCWGHSDTINTQFCKKKKKRILIVARRKILKPSESELWN